MQAGPLHMELAVLVETLMDLGRAHAPPLGLGRQLPGALPGGLDAPAAYALAQLLMCAHGATMAPADRVRRTPCNLSGYA